MLAWSDLYVTARVHMFADWDLHRAALGHRITAGNVGSRLSKSLPTRCVEHLQHCSYPVTP